MVKSSESSLSLQTSRDKRWPYDEYYFGDRDNEDRKNGQGENHWTGAESLEWYIGPMLRDTMHGQGDYRWRYKDPDGSFVTYEGQFFANQMHGYGMMSYPDGRVFIGLYYKNVRWGPGVERKTCLQANVGFWRGTQLARLNWRPDGPSIAPNLATGNLGPAFLDSYRIVLKKHTRIIGQTNSALERLKHYGADPIQATEKWMKLYPKYCTDMDSLLCQTDLFTKTYYKGKVQFLSESQCLDEVNSQDDNNSDEENKNSEEIEPDIPSYFAWNNSEIVIHMMKHCYRHEKQRARVKLNLESILNGPRKRFRPASKHENDCRSLLLSSYTGNVINVTQLVNEEDVYPDISDNLGNTALMYAACGDEIVVIHFLVEAGANVDAFNDSCCTPLGVALMRYACIASDVPRSAIVNTLLPQKKDKTTPSKRDRTSPEIDQIKAADWLIIREATEAKSQNENELKKSTSIKKFKSAASVMKKPVDSANHEKHYDSDDDIFSDEKKLFLRASGEYNAKINSQFMGPVKGITDGYLFATRDMAKEIDATQEEMIKALTEKQPSKGATKGKAIKDPLPKGSVFKVQSVFAAEGSLTSFDKEKMEALSKIRLTILQLLEDGADPRLVKCPQPAILLAMKSGNPELVKNLVTYGADINQKFPDLLDYTVLDMVISEPFSTDNLEMIRTLLEIGADTQHRLKYEDPNRVPDQDLEVPIVEGPTLLHAVILKKAEFEFEEDIRNTELELLLQYNADPTVQYKGHSAIDCAMMLKKLRLLDPFILHPGTNLNSIINENNQTILVKLFSKDYFKTVLGVEKIPTLTNLLLYGADPLIECFDGDVLYGNMFEYAQKVLQEIAPAPVHLERKLSKQPSVTKGKSKGKLGIDKKDKSKSKVALPPVEDTKKKDKGVFEAVAIEYRECLGMMRECARLLHVRWLQAKLLKELINVINKFKHRHWTMIIREHKNGHRVGLWVSTSRCIEIWNILETTNKKKYKDKKILRTLLRIIQFYQKRLKAQLEITPYMTATEKNIIEADVGLLMREHRIASHLTKEAEAWKRPYVKPELIYKGHKKFKVCFECSLRLQENEMTCDFCGLVSFCNYSCMNANIEGTSGHPCSEKLREKYTMQAEDNDNITADATTT